MVITNLKTDLGLDMVNVCVLQQPQGEAKPSGTLPLVITPRWDRSRSFLCKFIEANRPWLDQQILDYGAVLIRGFDLDTPSDFEQAMLAVQPNLCDSYRGTSPRSLQGNTKFIFSAADCPVNYPIAQHLEMSFLKAPPRQLYFGCMKASSSPGGETSLCDFRKVYNDIPDQLREKLQKKKILYVRRHKKVGERYTYDVGAMLSWPQLFGTDNKGKVNETVREEGAPEVKWSGPNKDTFLQVWTDDAFQKHPVTGEDVWFNHSQVFHWTTFPMELWYAFCRVRDFQLLLHFILVGLFNLIKYGILRYEMALTTKFGDGTPISAMEMAQIRRAIHKNMVFSRWQKGDIMCIDNFSTSHGRQPTYDRSRKVVVAWSHPHDKTQPVAAAVANTTVTSVKTGAKILKPDSSFASFNNIKTEVPDLSPATPDDSPASTLTSSEAEQLQELMQMNMILEQKLGEVLRQRKSAGSFGRRQKSCPVIFQEGADFWKELVKAE